MSALSLSLLGFFRAKLGEKPLPGFRTNKVQIKALIEATQKHHHLKLLSCHDRRRPADYILACDSLLWDDAGPEFAV